MKCIINVYYLNEHFSQEHADAHHEGKPSANNRKYEWEDEMKITTEVQEVVEHRKASFPLAGELPNGEAFSHDVSNMMLFEIISEGNPSTFVGCSESMLHSARSYTENDTFRVEIVIKENEPMANPIPGIYIASLEFPKALVF
jgi:hypothetical protein